MLETQTHTHTENDMPIATSTSLITIIFKNLMWLLALAFYPLVDYVIKIVPTWKDNLENIKLVGGAIIVLLVILKLLLEISKLILKKDK